MNMRLRLAASVLLLPLPFSLVSLRAEDSSDRIVFSDSIRGLTDASIASSAVVTRDTLSATESEAPMHLAVSLQMRHAIELHTRLSSGETISKEEMDARYLSTQADYDKAVAWLTSEGFALDDLADPTRLNIFVHHSVANVARVFQVKFAR